VQENVIVVTPGRPSVARIPVEVDASGMSYYLAAAAVTGTTVEIPGIGGGSAQGDVGLARAFEHMGCKVVMGAKSITITGGALSGIDIDMEEMPDGLRHHLRYSRSYLDTQIAVLARYHQENPRVFHGQQDLWAPALELSTGDQGVSYRPEYALLTPPGDEEPAFALSALFVPQGRNTLAAFLLATWDAGRGGELRLWDLPEEAPFQGPRQIDAMVEQDPRIAEQFSLWRQGGSQVWTGHLHLVPAAGTLIYMEPVFLAADADGIPEIRRFLVSDGARVVMSATSPGPTNIMPPNATAAMAIAASQVSRAPIPREIRTHSGIVTTPATT